MISSTAALTSGKIEMDKGFEYYTFELAFSGFEAMAEHAEPRQCLASWYTSSPRPAFTEIVGIHDTKLNLEEKRVVITLKIMRGHYEIADFMAEHYLHDYRVYSCDDRCCIVFHCNTCETTMQIYKHSIPGHDKPVLRPDSPEPPATVPSEPGTPVQAL